MWGIWKIAGNLKKKIQKITIDGTVRLFETCTLFFNLRLFLVFLSTFSSAGVNPLNEKRLTDGGGTATEVFCIKLALLFFFRNNFEFPADSGWWGSSWSPTSVLEELLDVVSVTEKKRY